MRRKQYRTPEEKAARLREIEEMVAKLPKQPWRPPPFRRWFIPTVIVASIHGGEAVAARFGEPIFSPNHILLDAYIAVIALAFSATGTAMMVSGRSTVFFGVSATRERKPIAFAWNCLGYCAIGHAFFYCAMTHLLHRPA